MTDAEACIAEIVELHLLFERWMGDGEGDFGRFEAAFADGFSMIGPTGRRLDRAGILAFLREARGVRGAGFRIVIEEAEALHIAPPLLLMHYIERQWLAGGVETARRASALFRMEKGGPRWLAVQETWAAPPPG